MATYIHISTDAGGTVVDISPGDLSGSDFISCLIISEGDSDDLLAFEDANGDLYASDDQGDSWTKQAGVLPFGIRAAMAAPEDVNIVFAGRDEENTTHLQSSDDGGATWAEDSDGITPNNAEITAIQVLGGL